MNKYFKEITNLFTKQGNIIEESNMDSIITDIANKLHTTGKKKKINYFEKIVKQYIDETYTKAYVLNKLIVNLPSNDYNVELSSDNIISDNTLSQLLDDNNDKKSNINQVSNLKHGEQLENDNIKSDESKDIVSINELLDVMSDNEIISDKIQINTYHDLISHVNDLEEKHFINKLHKSRYKKVKYIKSVPQFEQKSTQWLRQRSQCLTATAIAIALDEDPYSNPIDLLFDKCGCGKPFVENENVHHGKKYEEIGNMYYSFRNNVNVGEYGLIQHSVHTFIGASPDGICEKTCRLDNKLNKNVGRLLEIKFPKKRKIVTQGLLDGEICPHYYYVQVQTQLFVTELDECDFLQCEMEEYKSEKDYDADGDDKISGLSKKTGLERGIIIQLLPKKMHKEGNPLCLFNAKYIYPPKLHMNKNEEIEWIKNEENTYSKNQYSDDYFIDRVIYWRFKKIACNLINADNKWMQSKIPLLKQFWDYVEFYRKNNKLLKKLIEYVEKVPKDNSALIFKRVHTDYLSMNNNCKLNPLYQTETEWRKNYNKKKLMYAKYIKK